MRLLPAAPAVWLPSGLPRASVQLNEATRIIVCNGRLCAAQSDGCNAAQLLAALRAKADELPCAVEESPCLSACGRGAMCSIDFEDGSCSITAGPEQCFTTLGIDGTILSGVVTPTGGTASPASEPTEEIYNDGMDALARMRASRATQERPAWVTFFEAASELVDKAKQEIKLG